MATPQSQANQQQQLQQKELQQKALQEQLPEARRQQLKF